MNIKIQRYDFEGDSIFPGMEESPNGDYVKFEDVVKLIEKCGEEMENYSCGCIRTNEFLDSTLNVMDK